MRCPKCRFEQPDQNMECVRCGLIFSKYAGKEKDRPEAVSNRSGVTVREADPPGFHFFEWLRDTLFHVEGEPNVFHFGARALLFLVLLIYFFKYLFVSVDMSYRVMPFMHLVNLPFHEAGHIIFMPFGRLIMFLGGTLGQLLMPFICMAALLITTRDNFGGSACLWWIGQNFIDIAPYINDARALRLILLGGVTGRETEGHDWQNILGTLGWLRYDHTLATLAYAAGIVLMVGGLSWGAYLLFWQSRNLKA